MTKKQDTSIQVSKDIKLPINWCWLSIGETGDYINGFAFKPQHREATGLPIIRIQNLTNESKALNCTTLPVPDEYHVYNGDMLVSWSATLDVFIWRGEHALLNQHIFKVVPNTKLVDQRLLYFWLKGAIKDLLETEHLHGSTMKHINRGPFMAHQIPMPPLSEQIRIADKLEELMSDLDTGVNELKTAQKKLTQYRQSLLKAAVEGALTAEWRANNTSSESGSQLLERILKERRARWEQKQLDKFNEQGKTPPKDWQKKYIEPVNPDTTGLMELPEGWVWASAEQLCDFITKGTTPPKGLESSGEKEIPFLRVTNLTHYGVLDLSDKVFVSKKIHRGFLSRSMVFPNDVLMNIVGPPLGQVSVVPTTFAEWNINQAIAIFRALDGVLPNFICTCLQSPTIQSWLNFRAKTTAGQTNLTLEVCRSLPIPLPPKLEQVTLIQALDMMLNNIFEQEKAIKVSLKQSAAQRKNILKAAFSGQLVPQDPNDEPASVLLEHIKAERLAQGVTKKPRQRSNA